MRRRFATPEQMLQRQCFAHEDASEDIFQLFVTLRIRLFQSANLVTCAAMH